MLRYRLVLITTFFWLIVLFNIERIDLLQSQPFNLDTSFYIVTLFVVVAIVTFPNLGRQNPVGSSFFLIAVYTVIGLLFRPGWTERWFIFPVMEFVALELTYLLMREVSAALLEFEVTVETFILNLHTSRMLSRTAGEEKVDDELYLAKRFERDITVVYCHIPELPDEQENSGETTVITDFIRWRITSEFRWRFRQSRMARLISTITYKGDLIVEYEEGIVICLPETGYNAATVFATQLSRMVQISFERPASIGLATFPEDGLAFEDLAAHAAANRRMWHDDDDGTDATVRAGDVWIEMEERLKINSEDNWFNQLAYQSEVSRRIYVPLKRLMDIILVLMSTPLILPVGLLVAFLIKREDGGSIFYMQNRTGFNGERFQMYKFRSMVPNAKAIPPTTITLEDGTVRHVWPEKEEDDPRITRIGRILRKTSLDELPQLLNVLIGNMSIVGPRPSTWDLDKYTLHQTERLRVKPGITGLWQVSARDSKNMDERLLWDLKYIDKVSLWLDIQIILRTVGQVFAKGGV